MILPRIRRLGDAAALAAVTSPSELLSVLYAHRGVVDPADVAPSLAGLDPVGSLLGLAQAVELLAGQIVAGGHILIVGDYDADGATGTAVGVRGLRALGARQVSFLVPSRFADGYGLSPSVVEAAAGQHPDLLVTVDNGIASIAGVARARELGIPVLVTDHHLAGEQLPEADAILNPNQPGCPFPSKNLAGVGVMFYLLAATRAHLRTGGWFGPERPEPNLGELLDLVALGTVADVVTLDRNNRILVEQGLRRIRAGRCCAGLRALLMVSGRDLANATATDLGFFAAPRLNAAGRLEEMTLGVECLLSDDPGQALEMARHLDEINRKRREIEGAMKDEAEAWVDNSGLSDEELPPALCLFGEDWHQGVSGIVAARIRERYHRPVIAFADGGDGTLRGSARSVDGLHMRDALDAVDRMHPGLILRFGGHAMAAGLTLPMTGLETFRLAFVQAVEAQLGATPPVYELLSDGELPAALLTLETAEALRLSGPWGKGFPEPRFDGLFQVRQARIVGERHLKLRVATADGRSLDAIGFHQSERLEDARGWVHLAYRLDVNEYQGRRSPQLILESLQASQ